MPDVSIAAKSYVVNARQVTTAAAIQLDSITTGRRRVIIQNLGPNAIWLATSAVGATAAAGFKIAAGATSPAFDIENGSQLWAKADTADQVSPADTRVMEFR